MLKSEVECVVLGVLPACEGGHSIGVMPWGIPDVVLLPMLVSSSAGELVLLAGAPCQSQHALAAQAQLDLELL